MKVQLEKGRDGEDIIELRAENDADYVALKHLGKITARKYVRAQLSLTQRTSRTSSDGHISLLAYKVEVVDPDDLK